MEINNIPLNNTWVKHKSQENYNYLELTKNENTTCQKLWYVLKSEPTGKFTTFSAYIGKEEISKIDNLSFHFRKLENKDQIKSKVSRNKKIIKIKT